MQGWAGREGLGLGPQAASRGGGAGGGGLQRTAPGALPSCECARQLHPAAWAMPAPLATGGEQG